MDRERYAPVVIVQHLTVVIDSNAVHLLKIKTFITAEELRRSLLVSVVAAFVVKGKLNGICASNTFFFFKGMRYAHTFSKFLESRSVRRREFCSMAFSNWEENT